jgi:hypothetical protein
MFNKKYLCKKSVIISLIGCLLLIIGNFIPLVEIASDTLEYTRTFNFISYEGKFIVFVSFIAMLLILLEEPKYAAMPLSVSALLLLYLIFNKSSLYDDCSFYESMFSWGMGLYVLVIGNILAFIEPFKELSNTKFTIKLKKEN